MSTSFHFDACFFFKRSNYGGGVSVLAEVMNGLPQMLQNWFHFFENGLFTCGHDPKLGIDRLIFAAKDRRIEKINITLCVRFLFSQTRRRNNSAHVDRDLPFVDSA